jgi:hypothetical protein
MISAAGLYTCWIDGIVALVGHNVDKSRVNIDGLPESVFLISGLVQDGWKLSVNHGEETHQTHDSLKWSYKYERPHHYNFE